MKKISLLLLATMLVFSFVACSDDDSSAGVSFTADPNSPLLVNNAGSAQIVLFASKSGSTGAGVLLGGVPGLAQAFGVPNLSTADGMFVLNIVTLADYKANSSNPRIASSTLVYVDDGPAPTYTISSGTIGDGTLKFYNQTENYVEIRGGETGSSPSWYSPPFTVLRPQEVKTIYLPSAEYDLYPVLKIERKSGNKIVGLAEKKLTALVDSYSFFGGNTQTITIPADTAQVDHTCTYIQVINNYNKGLRMVGGTAIIANSLGRQVCNSGGESSYTVDVTGTSVSKTYKFTDTLGTVVSEMSSSYTFDIGKVYSLTIPVGGGAPTVALLGAYETVYPATP